MVVERQSDPHPTHGPTGQKAQEWSPDVRAHLCVRVCGLTCTSFSHLPLAGIWASMQSGQDGQAGCGPRLPATRAGSAHTH